MPLSHVTFIKVADFRFISFSVYKLTLARSMPSVLARHCMHSVHPYTRTLVSVLSRLLFLGVLHPPIVQIYPPISVSEAASPPH